MPLFPAVSRRTLRLLTAAILLVGSLASATPALASYDSTVSGTPGLLSYWKLDEATGSVGADATGAFPGTYSSSAGLAMAGVAGIPGSNGMASMGSTLGAPAAYPFTGTAAYTLEAWVKLSSAQNSYNFIIDRELTSPSRSGYDMGITPGTTSPANALFCERWSNGAQRGVSSSVGLAVGVWYHVSCSFDGTTMTLAIDGQLNRTVTAGSIPDSSANPFRIGANSVNTGARPQATIDNVAVYSRALSASELSAHTVAGQTYKDEIRGAPGLRSHYALDALSSTHPDLGPANVNASLSGATATFGGPPLTSGGDASVALAGDGPINAPALQATNPGSTELWFRPRSLQTAWLWYTSTSTTGDGAGPEQETGVRLTAGGRIQLWSTGQTASYVDLGGYAAGESHQLAITTNGSIWRVFIDGAQVYGATVSSQTFAGYLPRTTYGGLFSAGAAGAFTGEMDDISTYNATLAAADVADHWALGRDTTAPDTLIGSGPADGSTVNANTATVDATATEPLLSTPGYRCSLDAAPATPCTLPATYPGLADGPHTVRIAARDAAGNVDPSPATRTWTVDTTAPSITIPSPPAAATTDTSAQITFAVSDSGASTECRTDGGSWSACTSPLSLTGLALGDHTVDFRATDSTGNASAPSQVRWTVRAAPRALVETTPATTPSATTPARTTTQAAPSAWTPPLLTLGTAQLSAVHVPESTQDGATFRFSVNKHTHVQIRAWCRASTTTCPRRARPLADDDDAATARLVFVDSMLVVAHEGRNAIRIDRLLHGKLSAGKYVISLRLVRVKNGRVVRHSAVVGRAIQLTPAS